MNVETKAAVLGVVSLPDDVVVIADYGNAKRLCDGAQSVELRIASHSHVLSYRQDRQRRAVAVCAPLELLYAEGGVFQRFF